MQGWMLISLIAMGLVFVAWAVSMFRMLWVMWQEAERRTAQENGSLFGGTKNRWTAFRDFFRDPEQRRLKWWILALTLLLSAIIIARATNSLQMQ